MSKYNQKDAYEYYRPSLDDIDFLDGPFQNMLPIYHYKNGFLVDNNILEENIILKEENENIDNHNYIYLYSCLFFLILLLFIKNLKSTH